MKNIISLVVVSFFCALICGCNDFSHKVLADDNCQEWNQDFAKLREPQLKNLQSEGITVSDNGYILSENLVADCKLRFEIGKYLWEVIAVGADKDDELFASKNSKEIVRVIRFTWNAYSDGASHEKYLLLDGNGIKEEDIAPFIIELLKKEGLETKDEDASLFFTLLNRPFSTYKTTIEELLENAEKSEDYLEQFLALTLLHQDSPKKVHLAKLKKIAQNPKLSKESQKLAQEIIKKLQRKETLEWQLVDRFEIEMDMNSTPVSPNTANK